MANRTTKRKRRLTWAILAGTIFLSVLLIIIYYSSNKKQVYIPGEDIEGLTSTLERDLPKDIPKITFEDVTADAGIDFNHFDGERSVQLPEDMGSGVAWGDYDNDGWQDVFLANFNGPLNQNNVIDSGRVGYCQLYHNNQDGTFTEVSKSTGLDLNTLANACAWADYNNDNHLDLFVSTNGTCKLFKNNGDATFTDVSSSSGVDNYNQYWAGIAWSDYNLDGHLDIYVCGYVNYVQSTTQTTTLQYKADVPTSINPSSFPPIKNLLLRNNGNGTFTDVAEKVGVANANGRSLEAAWCDFDDDGYPDLYVANDVSDNALFRNKGDGTFEDVSYASFVADYRGAMGIGTGDWDNDGDFDMFITHWLAQENALYTNLNSQINTKDIATSNRIKFMDEADRYGLGQSALSFIGFGTFFFDFDNDSRLDIFIANGSTFQKRDNPKELVAMKDKLLWNRSKEHGFYDISEVSGSYFRNSLVGRGTAFADYDNDGDLDIIIINNLGPAKLLRNDGGNEQNWIQLKLHQKDRNTFAVSAKIKAITGNIQQLRQVGSQGPYFSQNSLIQHFGLGSTTCVDTLEITWSHGKKQKLYDVGANQIVHIFEK